MATTGQVGGPLQRLARLFGFGMNGSASSTVSGAQASTAPAASAVRQDWATLPPLRTPLHRRVAESSHVTQFSTDLRRQLGTPAALAPLGHQVAMEAPRGIATGIARVVGPSASHDLADLPLPARDHPRPTDDHADWPPATPTPTPAPTPNIAPGSPSAQPRGPMAPPDRVATPSVTTGTTSPVVGMRASAPTAPRILRAALPSPGPITSPPVSRPAGLTLRRVRAVAEDAPHPGHADRPSPITSHVAGHDDAPVDRPPADAPSVPDRPTLGAAPLTPPPQADRAAGRAEPPAQLQRDLTDLGVQRASSLPPSRAERPPSGVGPALPALPTTARPVTRAQRQAGPSVTGHGRQDAIAKGLQHLLPTSGAAPADMPVAPPPMRTAAPQDPAGPPVLARRLPPRPGHVAVQRAVSAAPLVGDRPPLVSPRPTLTPPVDGAGAADGSPDGQPRDGSPAVPVRWQHADPDPAATLPTLPEATAPPGPRRGSARSTTEGPQPSPSPRGRVSRQTTPVRGPEAPPVLRSAVAPTSTAVPLRRRPDEPTAQDPTTGPGVARAVDHAVRAEGLPLPRLPALLRAVDDAAPAPHSTPTSVTAAGEAAGPTAPAHPAGRPPPPPIQRETESGATPAADGPEAAPAAADATTDVNAIFRKLYPRVRDELRWELRVQRERAGMLSDPL